MRVVLVAILVCAVAVPAALAAEPSTPSTFCKKLQKTSPLLFGVNATYRNLGACVAAQSAVASQSATSAAKACKAEQADANFAATHAGKSFVEFYAADPNAKKADKTAYSTCVATKAAAATAQQQAAVLNASKRCKAERADPNFAATHGGKTFAQFYGKNANLRNAFGKCVSAYAKAPPA